MAYLPSGLVSAHSAWIFAAAPALRTGSSTPARTSPPQVGLTRARVSQVLKDAEAAGLALERIKGRGYRLLEAPDFLDAKAVALGARRACRRAQAIAFAAHGRGRRPDRVDVVRAPAPRAAARRSRRRARRRVADGGTRPPRPRLDGDRRRQPHVLARLEVRAGRGLPRRTLARRRRRRRARARGRGLPRTSRSSGRTTSSIAISRSAAS